MVVAHLEVLAVAHLDSHQKLEWVGELDHPKGKRIYCPRADDRLGVYTILDLLPRMGVVCDVLITNHEESGGSTAEYFKPQKDYKWMFQFDRKGDDVALYDYWGEKLINKLRIAGFKNVSRGSYTDICKLYDLGISGFNVGCGYDDYHTEYAFFELSQYFQGVINFMEFYRIFGNARIPYVKPKPVVSYYGFRDHRRLRQEWWDRPAHPEKAWASTGSDWGVTWKCSKCWRVLKTDFDKNPTAREQCDCGKEVAFQTEEVILIG